MLSFVVDFYCHASKLVIEVDGVFHQAGDNPCYDAVRAAVLQAGGLKVIRFTDREVLENLDSVLKEIERNLIIDTGSIRSMKVLKGVGVSLRPARQPRSRDLQAMNVSDSASEVPCAHHDRHSAKNFSGPV